MRWKCICAYDGTDFDGWQRQPQGGAVQNHIEAALSQIFSQKIQIHGSGRTDAGVHAKGQCFHFDADWAHNKEKLIRALHSILVKTIKIKSLTRVGTDFHARYSVTGKRYIYHYYLGRAEPVEDRYVWACRDLPVDLDAMNEAAKRLIGTHDFTALSATHGKDSDPNPIKTVHRLDLKQRGNRITLTTEGSGYLYRMVRSFAGALYSVGRGRLTPDDISEILESKKRTHRIITAPGQGLFLDKVYYKNSPTKRPSV
jgi:tRNA pseudouridine38-40 synthase